MKQILAIVFLGYMTFGAAQEERVISWSPEVRLSWNDFKGKPTSDEAAATTASGITYSFSSNSQGDEVDIDFTVTTHFYPDKSWYRPAICDSFILRHEQLHFDIAELFARKMRKKLASTKFTRNVKAEVGEIYDEINIALYAFQHRYDNETNFSRNREAQQLWNRKIEGLLNE